MIMCTINRWNPDDVVKAFDEFLDADALEAELQGE